MDVEATIENDELQEFIVDGVDVTEAIDQFEVKITDTVNGLDIEGFDQGQIEGEIYIQNMDEEVKIGGTDI